MNKTAAAAQFAKCILLHACLFTYNSSS